VSPQTVLVGTFHSYRETPSFPYKYARSVFRRVVNLLDKRIAVSPAACDYINAYFPSSYQVIPNGVDLAHFGNRNLPPLPQFSDGLNILFVGRLEPRKGFRYLMEAYAQVKTRLPQVRLLVAGPYTAQESLPFERELQRRRLGDVHFVGYLSEQDLARYYQTSQVFCAPSIGFESFGMVLLEAMAAGTPVVAFDIEGYRNLITHPVGGLLVKPRDVSALADAVIHVLQSGELRQAMSRYGQATAARYTWDRVADQVLDCYEGVFEQRLECDKAWDRQFVRRGIMP
jgi:phosphatidylinositol alpha-mannosyltransferase